MTCLCNSSGCRLAFDLSWMQLNSFSWQNFCYFYKLPWSPLPPECPTCPSRAVTVRPLMTWDFLLGGSGCHGVVVQTIIIKLTKMKSSWLNDRKIGICPVVRGISLRLTFPMSTIIYVFLKDHILPAIVLRAIHKCNHRQDIIFSKPDTRIYTLTVQSINWRKTILFMTT